MIIKLSSGDIQALSSLLWILVMLVPKRSTVWHHLRIAHTVVQHCSSTKRQNGCPLPTDSGYVDMCL